MSEPKPGTVGAIRHALEGLPDDMTVIVEVTDRDGDLAQAFLTKADVEARCDEVDRLYLWGTDDEEAGNEEAT